MGLVYVGTGRTTDLCVFLGQLLIDQSNPVELIGKMGQLGYELLFSSTKVQRKLVLLCLDSTPFYFDESQFMSQFRILDIYTHQLTVAIVLLLRKSFVFKMLVLKKSLEFLYSPVASALFKFCLDSTPFYLEERQFMSQFRILSLYSH
jgi:hypothetical protein